MKGLVFTETPVMCLNAGACHEFLPQKDKADVFDYNGRDVLIGSLAVLAVEGWFYFAFVPLLGIEKFLGFKIDWFMAWLWSSVPVAIVCGAVLAVQRKRFLDFIGGFVMGLALIPAVPILLFAGLMFLSLWLMLIFGTGGAYLLILCAVRPKWFSITSIIILCMTGVFVFLAPIVHWLI